VHEVLMPSRFLLLLLLAFTAMVHGESPDKKDSPALTGPQYIAAAKAARPQGSLLIRMRMEQKIEEHKTNVINVQIKRRSLPNGHSEQFYTVTFSKDPAHKGEALLLRTSDKGFTGALLVPGKELRKLSSADRRMSVFGTDLALEDVVGDFLNWRQHTIQGEEKQGGNACVIVESTPDSAGEGPTKVRSWMEQKRYFAWRVEIFDGGNEPARVVQTEAVMRAKNGYWFPRTFTISTPKNKSITEISGTSADSDAQFTDADFSEAALSSQMNK